MAERRIQCKKAWNEQIFFNRVKSAIENFDEKINRDANAETFLLTVDVDVNDKKIMNVVDDGENESSAVNVCYVSKNSEEEIRCRSVFESNGDVIVREGSVVNGYAGVLVDGHQIGIKNAIDIMIKEAGLYKVDMGINVSECFVTGFVEFVVSVANEDDVSADTIVKKCHLNEGLDNIYCKAFDVGCYYRYVHDLKGFHEILKLSVGGPKR